MSNVSDYWSTPRPHVQAKMEIVSKYFGAWLRILKDHCDTLRYLDIFSGRGKFDDGKPATPLMILDEISRQPDVLRRIRLDFYESKDRECELLHESLMGHQIYSRLGNKPVPNCVRITSKNVDQIEKCPCTFTFIDPYGYKGLSGALLSGQLLSWGSDLVFNLSTQGIRRNIARATRKRAFVALLGADGLDKLRDVYASPVSWRKKDEILVDQVSQTLASINHQSLYYRHIAMQFEEKKLTSYFLVFLTKGWQAYKVMKDVMSQYSEVDEDGLPTYVWSKGETQNVLQLPLGPGMRMKSLLAELLQRFGGKRITVGRLCDQAHQYGNDYPTQSLKTAIGRLEEEGKVTVDIPKEKRRKYRGKSTLGDSRVLTFV